MSDTTQGNGDFSGREIVEFSGSNVPRKALFDHLGEGGTLESFLARFPTVTRERAETILVLAELKQSQMQKANGPVDLYTAYLATANEPEDEEAIRQFQEEQALPFNALAIEDLVREVRAELAAAQKVQG